METFLIILGALTLINIIIQRPWTLLPILAAYFIIKRNSNKRDPSSEQDHKLK
ncbi:hypothetical protein [Tissierella sp.]|uniref:hypothetical protein n=1 Tax=Tissierella sp. TaxID=41274 RepID=UPI00306AC8E7